MFGLGPATRIYLAAGVTDMRKGFEEWELHSQWATDLTESARYVQAVYAAA